MYIAYGRISTNNPEQLTSLKNQLDILHTYINNHNLKNVVTVTEIKSISNEMSDKIKKLCSDNTKLNIIVSSLDRLTRNVSDFNFMKNNIENIHVANENKIYNMKSDWKFILQNNISSMEEIEKIKIRLKSNPNKRKRDDEELFLNAKKRCLMIKKTLDKSFDKLSQINFLEDMCSFITCSHSLETREDWNKINDIYKKYVKKNLLNNYNIYNDEIVYLSRNDIHKYVTDMFSSKGISETKYLPFIKEFINANINYAKKYAFDDKYDQDAVVECEDDDTEQHPQTMNCNHDVEDTPAETEVTGITKYLSKIFFG